MIPNLAPWHLPFSQHASKTLPKKVLPQTLTGTFSLSLELFPFRSLNIEYMDQSNTTPRLPLLISNIIIVSPHPHLSFVSFSQCLTGNSPMRFKRTLRSSWNLCIRLRVSICVFFPIFSLHLVDLPSGTSGSYPSTLNGILSPGRRDSVGPWLALSVSSIECSNISIQIFYFANQYFLLFAIIGV